VGHQAEAVGAHGEAQDALFGEAPLGRRQGTAQFVVRFDDLRTARAAPEERRGAEVSGP
jgi:hypothetical protein